MSIFFARISGLENFYLLLTTPLHCTHIHIVLYHHHTIHAHAHNMTNNESAALKEKGVLVVVGLGLVEHFLGVERMG